VALHGFAFPRSANLAPFNIVDCVGVFLGGVILGGTKIDGSDKRLQVAVKLEIPHPGYSTDTNYNDIMLVKLSTRVTSLPFQSLSMDITEPQAGEIVKAVSSTMSAAE
jgi:Trypsin